MKNSVLVLFFFCINILFAQDVGFRFGLTTATPTGNNDAYDFDFLNSLVPGYKVGLFKSFVLSDVIIVKPEISYRRYTIKQKIDFGDNTIYDSQQAHATFAGDLNFDVELSYVWSLIFGMGIDYLISKNNIIYVGSENESYDSSFDEIFGDERLDPFATVGLCYRPRRSLLLDLEYRHLLDNWDTGNTTTISASNGSVKLHMINLSVAVLF